MFDNNEEAAQTAFRYAVDIANAEILSGSKYKLEALPHEVDTTNVFAVSKQVCSMLRVSKRIILYNNLVYELENEGHSLLITHHPPPGEHLYTN